MSLAEKVLQSIPESEYDNASRMIVTFKTYRLSRLPFLNRIAYERRLLIVDDSLSYTSAWLEHIFKIGPARVVWHKRYKLPDGIYLDDDESAFENLLDLDLNSKDGQK